MSLLWSLVVLVVANAVAIGALLTVRRGAPEGSYFSDGDRASGVFGVLATGFAIFAGFVVFLAFTSYDQSRSGAEREALTVVQQFETAHFLPASVRRRLSGELVCYGRSVVNGEWPEMESGDAGDAINPWGLALFRTLQPFEPSGAAEDAAFSKWLDQTSEREEARRDRIHGASGIIPTSVWLVLFLTASVVFLPQMGGYAAKVLVIIVFLAAYEVPVTFGSVMSVLGSNQLANLLSLTPGGVGVNQAFNSFALASYTDQSTATAYSVGQQLLTTAFNAGFAIVLMCIVFGWKGGSELVRTSYADAKVKASEMKQSRGDILGAEEDPV